MIRAFAAFIAVATAAWASVPSGARTDLPDFAQMDPAFRPILGGGEPLCGPVVGANLLAWLHGKEKVVLDPSPGPLTAERVLPWVKKLASPDFMNTRDNIGTLGPDLLSGLDKALSELKVKHGKEVAGPAFGSAVPVDLGFLGKKAGADSAYVFFLGYYRPGNPKPGLRRMKGHAIFAVRGPDGRFFATDPSPESGPSPSVHHVDFGELRGQSLRAENKVFKGRSPPVLIEVKGVPTPGALKIRHVLVEGIVRYDFGVSK